jgi:polysaccharide export outer membrane protein
MLTAERVLSAAGRLTRCVAIALLAACGAAAAQEAASGGQNFSVQGDQYRIGANDLIEVSVWQAPEVSATVRVRPDGQITTPLVEDLVASGKTPSELAREIEAALAVYYRSPEVSVIVREFVGVMAEQIQVIGRGIANGSVPYVNGMTVMQVVLAMGGLNEFAAGNRARVIREVDGETVEIRVRLDDLMNKGRTDESIAMRPGDILSVPEARF